MVFSGMGRQPSRSEPYGGGTVANIVESNYADPPHVFFLGGR